MNERTKMWMISRWSIWTLNVDWNVGYTPLDLGLGRWDVGAKGEESVGGRGVVRCCFDAAVAVAVQSSGGKVRAAATPAVRLPSASSLARSLL